MSDPNVGKDYYSILGAEQTTSQHEIERLYKRLAKQHHPDRGGDTEEMKAINEAFRVLGNAATRRTYDSLLQRRTDDFSAVGPPLSPPSSLLSDTVPGRLLGAFLFLLAGLVFLFLVRIYYIRFMWPILLAALLVVIFGVWRFMPLSSLHASVLRRHIASVVTHGSRNFSSGPQHAPPLTASTP